MGRVDLLMDLQRNMDLLEKLAILSDAAKYDVACTSSGVDRKGKGTGMGNTIAPGVLPMNASITAPIA